MSLTLAPQEICVGAMESFKENLPFLKNITADVDTAAARYNQTIISRIPSIPQVTEYNQTPNTPNQGYEGGGVTDVKSLLSDVPVQLNKWKKVSIGFNYVDTLKASINLTENMLAVAGLALAKQVASDLLGLVTPANFSQSEACHPSEVRANTLESIRSQLNGRGALSRRWGVVNSTVAQSLLKDEKIASADYLHQYNTGVDAPYRTISAGGFTVYEIPWLQNTNGMIGFFADPRALILVSRPTDEMKLFNGAQYGIREIYTDPQTGLSMQIIGYQVPPNLDWQIHLSLLYGIAGGSQGGTTGALLDYSGVRLVEGNATGAYEVRPTLTVIVKDKQVTYGGAAPTYSVEYSGFIDDDDSTDLGGSLQTVCAYRQGDGAGTYPITATGLTSGKYNIVYVSGTLTVAKAPLFVTANNESVTEGAAVPTYSASIVGYVNGDDSSDLSGMLTFACDYSTSSDEGTYSITPSGLTSDNYSFTYASGTCTVSA